MSFVEHHHLYKALEPHVTPQLFGVQTVQELFASEYEKRYLVDLPRTFDPKRLKRSNQKGDAVLYMNLDGGGGGEACPSIADSSAVSLSQMAFLSMTVSIFSVVASIANNLNNNNNNNNDNNINFIQQKQNNLNMNQNIVNQINISLPPPVPGKRSLGDPKTSSVVKKMIKQKMREWQRRQQGSTCSFVTDHSPEAANALLNIIKSAFSNKKYLYDTPNNRQCIGRELCLKATAKTFSMTPVESVVYQMQTFALLFDQLDDTSTNFSDFLTKKAKNLVVEDCFELFPDCGVIDDYVVQTFNM